jgi:hypothetical protein
MDGCRRTSVKKAGNGDYFGFGSGIRRAPDAKKGAYPYQKRGYPVSLE